MTNTTIGEQLRHARLAQNLDLSQIAEETKIGKYYLEAIEANQIERLPGLFFYKAFVRQYSKILKVDGKKLETQINAEHGAPEVTVGELRQSRLPMLSEPALRAANTVGGDLRLVLASIGLILVLVGGSVIYTWAQRPSSPSVAVAEQKPAYVPASGASGEKSVKAAAAPMPDQQASIREVVDNLTPDAGPGSNVSLSLSAIEPTWITITSDGKTVYTGILEPQQSKLLAGKQNVVIKVGNAAGLEVKWNGKAIGRIGDQKQVRTILFTDKDFQIVKPPAPAPNPVSL
ncbi:MAG TPA: RodZ domain-containing protein [Bryobacteraceae bacterium]|jgi:cytoskeletal protein RodZ